MTDKFIKFISTDETEVPITVSFDGKTDPAEIHLLLFLVEVEEEEGQFQLQVFCILMEKITL